MNKPKILIVDDDPVVRDVLSEIISNFGMDLDHAENGEEALQKITMNSFDVILSDITMPVMDGFQFLRHVKEYTPLTPVAIITGYPSLENAIEAMKEGARDFIVKPFNVEKIKTTIDRLLREKRLMGNHELNSKEALKRELIKRLQEIAILQSVSSELDELYDNKKIYEQIVEMVSRLLMVKDVFFGIIKKDSLRIENSTISAKKELPLPETLKMVIRNKTYVILNPGERNPFTGTILSHQLLIIPLILNREVFGILGVSGKINGLSFTEDEIYIANTFAKKISLRIENNALYELFYNNLLNTLRSLIASIEARDSYTKQHSERVTNYALQICDVMGLSNEERDSIQIGGYLHDIGKIGVRDTVLLKQGSLTEEEFKEIKLHPVIGESIVRPLKFLPEERALILHHHERFDGRGYPDGLSGSRIPLLARILAVADTYDAITSTRPYRAAMSHDKAIAEIKTFAGTQFDPEIVKAFLQTPAAKGGRAWNS